jgi:hypothetical protein
MEELEPLTDILTGASAKQVTKLMRAAMLDLLGMVDEIDEEDIVTTLGNLEVDAGPPMKAVMTACKFVLKEASETELTDAKIKKSLGKIGFSADQASGVCTVLREAKKKKGTGAGPDLFGADIDTDPLRVSDLFDEDMPERGARKSIFEDVGAPETGAKTGGVYDDIDEELARPEQLVGQFEFRHIEVPTAKVNQAWKPKGGDEIFVTYEVKTHVTVRVEFPPGELHFECDSERTVTSVAPTLHMAHVTVGTKVVAFNDRNLGQSVPWSKVLPVIESFAGTRSVTFAVMHPFIVRKRYSEFDELTRMVKEAMGSGAAVPKLPGKTLLKSSGFDKKFIGERREVCALCIYLTRINVRTMWYTQRTHTSLYIYACMRAQHC